MITVQYAHLQQDQIGTLLHTKRPRARNKKQEIRQIQIQTVCNVVASLFLYTLLCAFLFYGAALESTLYGYIFEKGTDRLNAHSHIKVTYV